MYQVIEKKLKNNNQKGFSLMEVLLVVFILSTALMVFIQVTAKSIVYSIESQDSAIAAGLAQEGVELIKNIRDNNWADKNGAFDNPFPSSSDCWIDYNDSTCAVSADYNLDFGGGFYNHGNGEETKFSRKIIIDGANPEKRVVTSYVVWSRPDFPSPENIPQECHPVNKCVYATITLTKWGEE